MYFYFLNDGRSFLYFYSIEKYDLTDPFLRAQVVVVEEYARGRQMSQRVADPSWSDPDSAVSEKERCTEYPADENTCMFTNLQINTKYFEGFDYCCRLQPKYL